MFNVNVPSSEIYKISTRPAVFKALAQTLEYFNILQNHRIFFNGEAEVSKLLGGNFNDNRGSDLDTDVGFVDQIFIELERDYAGYNDELDSENKAGNTVPLFWIDPATKSSIRPIFQGRKYTVTINKFFKDRVTAQTFHSRIRSALISSNLNTNFDVITHYPISTEILLCYQSIYKRLVSAKVIVEGPNMNFIKWFRKNALFPTDIISNLIGNNDCLVFKNQLAENGLNYGEVNFAHVTKGNYMGQYEVSFSFWFFWNEHVKWELKYPIQVYQQPLDSEWIPDVFEQNKMDPAGSRFLESRLAKSLFGDRDSPSPYYHVLPPADNWRPPAISWLAPQLQVLVNMEDVHEQVILNVKDINGFTWNETFIKYIMKFRTKVTKRHKNPLQFKVFSNEIEVLESQIELRENGDLVLLRKPTMSNIYRVVFYLDYALRQYDDECTDDLINDPDWGKWIIGVLFPIIVLPPDWGSNGKDDWWDIHNKVEVGDGEQVDHFPNGMMGFHIIALRQGNPRF